MLVLSVAAVAYNDDGMVVLRKLCMALTVSLCANLSLMTIHRTATEFTMSQKSFFPINQH